VYTVDLQVLLIRELLLLQVHRVHQAGQPVVGPRVRRVLQQHSTIDGATVLAAVGRMQQVEIHDAPAAVPELVIEAPDQLLGDREDQLLDGVVAHLERALLC
jgi:hypothetical protein